MKEVNWEKYTNESIEFAFQQSSKALDETFTSARETSNKSYILLAPYTGVLSFCFNKVIEHGKFSWQIAPYITVGIGMIIVIGIIGKNLMPRTMIFSGTKPNELLDDFFLLEENLQKQKREMTITRIIDHDRAISSNMTQIYRMGSRFINSLLAFLFFLFLGLIVALI